MKYNGGQGVVMLGLVGIFAVGQIDFAKRSNSSYMSADALMDRLTSVQLPSLIAQQQLFGSPLFCK